MFCSENGYLKCVNLLIMRFDGSVVKICERILLENCRLHCHFGQSFLNLDAKSILSA